MENSQLERILDELKPSPSEQVQIEQQEHHNESTETLRLSRPVTAIPVDLLNPPRRRRERFRDWLLRLLDRPEFQVMGLVVMFLVVAVGAIFFFFLMGWQTLCDTPAKMDCSPRNEVYNISVQILTGLFTYMVTVTLPCRCANFIQIFGCSIRDNSKGLDLYGRPTNDVWFHISWYNRAGIITCLMMNCILQYANQIARIIFITYDSQDTTPGLVWVNLFFVSSFLFAGIGGAWTLICSEQLRKHHPGQFGPGASEYCDKIWGWICCRPEHQAETGEEELDESERDLRQAEEKDEEEDPTQ
eukprot:CAMPEP_0198147352 /NCGR_PEP_ID=MMETSP1443-20131203/34916_1 /TAXON_ID=186043 /ORGANISM="Entomoneis sp., Strain CCMP2396" /LENGTH=300 /DNA_ID=CAMNT_0043811637 /DNA_START=53 /DNA_END=955 /DNA_ORIENTATION=-